MSQQKNIAIGKIIKAHGIKGEALFLPYSGVFNHKEYKSLLIEDNQNFKEIKVISSRPYQGKGTFFIIALEKVSREEIQSFYASKEIFVKELNYNNLKDGEFFFQDLIDAKVFIDGDHKGTVLGAYNFGAQDVVEVQLFENNKKGNPIVAFFPLQSDFLIEMKINEKELYFENVENFL